MRFAFLLFLAMTLPAKAQQGTTITLSCNGTAKLTATAAADLKPRSHQRPRHHRQLGQSHGHHHGLRHAARRHHRHHRQLQWSDAARGLWREAKPFTINGSIDRVTGHTTIDWWHENVGDNGS